MWVFCTLHRMRVCVITLWRTRSSGRTQAFYSTFLPVRKYEDEHKTFSCQPNVPVDNKKWIPKMLQGFSFLLFNHPSTHSSLPPQFSRTLSFSLLRPLSRTHSVVRAIFWTSYLFGRPEFHVFNSGIPSLRSQTKQQQQREKILWTVSSPLLITHRKWAPVQHERKRAKQALDVYRVVLLIVCSPVSLVIYNFALKFLFSLKLVSECDF